MGDHTEALQIEFDPTKIPFESVVELFWNSHNPVAAFRGSQYKSAIWFADKEQKQLIDNSAEPLKNKYSRPLTTEVLPLGPFYDAEDYHQKYCLQRHTEIMQAFRSVYPTFSGFVSSTTAARLNGFSAGHGSKSLFENEKNSYGFEPATLEKQIGIR